MCVCVSVQLVGLLFFQKYLYDHRMNILYMPIAVHMNIAIYAYSS